MAIFDDKDGVWRTIGGRHIFIKNGQSISEAMKESGKFPSKETREAAKEENTKTNIDREDTINKSQDTSKEETKKVEETKVDKDTKPIDYEKYKNTKFEMKDGKPEVTLANGEKVHMMEAKDYTKQATEFADSLSPEEQRLVQNYVDAPGLSGELNSYTEDGRHGNKYMYNTTDNDYFITQNELNKYYIDEGKKYTKEVGPLKDLNPNWLTDEDKAYAKKVLGENATYNQIDSYMQGIKSCDPDDEFLSHWNKYYSPEEVKNAEIMYDKLRKLEDERDKYGYTSPDYDRLRNKIKEVGNGHDSWYYSTIIDTNKRSVFNGVKFDFEKEKEAGNIKYLQTWDIAKINKPKKHQATQFNLQKERTTNFYNKWNKLFDEKGVTLKQDTLLFRRARDIDMKDGTFTMHGLTSTSSKNTLPKKMPSGNWFGDKQQYILVPKGTKVVFSEKVIGRGYEHRPELNDTWVGVRRQHEVLLQPNTKFREVNGTWDFSKSKSEFNSLLIVEGVE